MRVYNTLTGHKEEFRPGNPITMYVCGVTVYDRCHIGHAVSYLVFDVVKRYLKFKGYSVRHVQNFTDIDDKVIKRAQEEGVDFLEVAERYINEYFADMDALNIQRADEYPRATQEIARVIEIVKALQHKGHAYRSNGNVYYRVRSFPDYGKLSRRSLEDMLSKSAAYAEIKQDPLDFALWKASKAGEPAWDSPWGPGRPGWHMECSAMCLKYLGQTIDVHGGGQDLIFPHHENEIAQSESYTGAVPFVRYWMHNGLLQQYDEKMSKSTGNIVPVKEVLDRFSPDAVRIFMLGSHYRNSLVYSEEALAGGERGAERLRTALRHKGPQSAEKAVKADTLQQQFVDAMDDDFNTPQALAVLFELARTINRGVVEGADVKEAQQVLAALADVLGLRLEESTRPTGGSEALIDLLISVRQDLRRRKLWSLADHIRDRLLELGIVLEDGPEGTSWKRKGKV